jgi:hypothetical protein
VVNRDRDCCHAQPMFGDPATRARLAAVATTPIFFTPYGFGAYVAQEVEKWGKVINAAGAKPN